MNEEIKKLIESLEDGTKYGFDGTGSDNIIPDVEKTDACMKEAAGILRAVFDPENQPSQFGTVLA